FAADPCLAEDLKTGHRYNAARAAALAGCGRGEDAAKLNEAQGTRWREQAREWLKADLTLWTKMVGTATSSGTTPDLAKKMLTQRQKEPDLAELREPNARDKLPADERKECIALWKSVADLIERAQAPAEKKKWWKSEADWSDRSEIDDHIHADRQC